MGVLLLVRHGQASFGAEDYDVLSATGVTQARSLGEFLGSQGVVPSVVLHGLMRRQRETAEELVRGAKWDIPVELDARWDEFGHLGVIAVYAALADGLSDTERKRLDTGDLDRRVFQQIFEKATARWASAAHDEEYDETYPAFVERVRDALAHAARLSGPGQLSVVVTSGGPIAAASAMLVDVADELRHLSAVWQRLNAVLVNASVTRVVVGSTGARLLTFNEHSCLGPDLLTYR